MELFDTIVALATPPGNSALAVIRISGQDAFSIVKKKIDKVSIPKNCLDVLSQQIYGMAIEKVYNIDELFDTIKRSYNYEHLSRQDFDSVIAYLSGEHVSLEDRHVYAKIWYDLDTKEIQEKP